MQAPPGNENPAPPSPSNSPNYLANPYAPPQAPPQVMAAPGPYGLTACPQCGSGNVSTPSFTWWGGLLGPKLLNHTVCNQCQFGFNRKTGKSNSKAIAIYVGVGVVAAIVLMVAYGAMSLR